MQLRGLFALACTASLAVTATACGDKAASASAVDSSMLAAHVDAGDGGARTIAENGDAGASVQDVALPPATGEELEGRMRHLLEAIAQENPDLAGDVLFPRDAFVQTKDLVDPQKAWEKKVSSPFRRAVTSLHKRTKGAETVRFTGFELGHSVLQITPKKKDWKRPLWRVKHSKLSFTVDGKARQFDIAEMTSWRGAWYVTRLR